MRRTGDGRDSTAEKPAWSSGSKKSRSNQRDIDEHRSKKKQRVTINQTETETATQTLNHTSTSYAHTYANSYSYSCSRGKEKRHKGKAKRAIADDKRKWVYSTHDVSPNQDRVVFMSYNILGVKNAVAHEDLYRNVSPKYLDWDYRKKLICKEIRKYNPGIMCFQEVDRFDDLDHLLQKEGFKGVYQARTGDACDGCAIFWNRKLFDVVHEESIEFQNFNLRNNVCQLCVFKMNVKSSSTVMSASNSESVSSPRFLVGNIHVLYNPNRGDIKLGQVRLFLESAQRLSQEWGDIPVMLAGDLNSMPQSAMYQFLTSNKGSSRTRENSGEPLATSYHSKFMGTVDYIWHTTEFVPVRVLDTLPVDILRRTRGLPSKKWGSDHLSLVCELALADEGSAT